jgi:hypothetical protein
MQPSLTFPVSVSRLAIIKYRRLLVDFAKLNQGVFFLNKYLANKENSVSNFDICWKGKADL